MVEGGPRRIDRGRDLDLGVPGRPEHVPLQRVQGGRGRARAGGRPRARAVRHQGQRRGPGHDRHPDVRLDGSPARLPRPGWRERTALGGVGTADAVAQAIVAVLGMPWVTGQVVAADGGVSLWSPIDPVET